MPVAVSTAFAYCLSYLRRAYATDLAGLKALAVTVFETATDEVVISSFNYEGGGHSGQVRFDKVILGSAIEALIAELDPDYVSPAPLPRREIGVTVRLGY